MRARAAFVIALALATPSALAWTLASPPAAAAIVLNVEFKFTPFTGDPAHEDHVQVVAGKAIVYVNRVMIVERDIDEADAMVMFDEHEITPSLWLPVESLGPVLRKGKNTFRVEFAPRDAKAPYHAQLRWASVLDEVSEQKTEDGGSATNQADQGVEDREVSGPVALEREFTADFAKDHPWHHAAPIAGIEPAEHDAIARLVVRRVAAFKPDFTAAYALLAGRDGVDVSKLRAAKCLEKAYAAGVRVAGPPADALEIVALGNPEVIVRAKDRPLFAPTDPKTFERIQGDDIQMCAGMALMALFPPRLAVVRAAKGGWEIVY